MKPKKIESFECYLCHTKLKSKLSNLRRHMKLHGPDIKSFKCSLCSNQFQTKSNLLVHWNSKHCSPQETPQFTFKMECHSTKRKLVVVVIVVHSFMFLMFILKCCCFYSSIARDSVYSVVRLMPKRTKDHQTNASFAIEI